MADQHRPREIPDEPQTNRPRRIRMAKMPAIPGLPAATALRDQLRGLVQNSPFPTLDAMGAVLPGQPSGKRLSELLRGHQLPDQHQVDGLVAACSPERRTHFRDLVRAARAESSAVAAPPEPELSAWVRATSAQGQRLPLVREIADWRRFGVHRPITLLSSGQNLTGRTGTGALPIYVLREKDRTQLRPALAAAAAGEGPPVMVLITGESTAGKTRAAVEAARAELADWLLLDPRTPTSLAQLLDRYPNLSHTVVWLDEVDEFLLQDRGIELLERLLDLPSGPMVLLATLRTDAENALQGTPAGRRLDHHEVRRVTLHRRPPPEEFAAELARARRLDDPWIVDALSKIDDGYGLAEWLAAGPQVLAEWERAGASERDVVKRLGAAIVAAAIDCYRAGYTTPVPESLLREAHRLYLPDHPVIAGYAVWPAALEWARAPVAGATGLLIQHRARGDRAFDYLLSHADRAGVPGVDQRIWPILARHATPTTLSTIAASAARHARTGLVRALAERAEAHLTYRADHGEERAAELLARVLQERGDEAELARRAAVGNEHTDRMLDKLLYERGDEAGLALRADAGGQGAGWLLAVLLHERGKQAELARRADNGDRNAAQFLARLLQERGDETELTRRAEAGNVHAASLLAELLRERQDETELARRARAGDPYAAQSWVWLQVDRADEVELAELADAGNQNAAMRLNRLLVERGDEAELTRRADNGDWHAARQLTELLVERHNRTELVRQADDGDVNATVELDRLLADQGDVAELTRRADRGDRHAGSELARLLAELGDEAELARRADNGDSYAPMRLAILLAERGDETELARRADNGDSNADRELATLLRSRKDESELTRLADAGGRRPARELIALLDERGDEAGLARRADAGDEDASLRLAQLLARRGDEAKLAQRAELGDRWAAQLLADVRLVRGRPEGENH